MATITQSSENHKKILQKTKNEVKTNLRGSAATRFLRSTERLRNASTSIIIIYYKPVIATDICALCICVATLFTRIRRAARPK